MAWRVHRRRHRAARVRLARQPWAYADLALSRWKQMAPVEITMLLEPGENAIGLEITQRDSYREFQDAGDKGNHWMVHLVIKSSAILGFADFLAELRDQVQVEAVSIERKPPRASLLGVKKR